MGQIQCVCLVEDRESMPPQRISKQLSESKMDIRILYQVGEHLDVNSDTKQVIEWNKILNKQSKKLKKTSQEEKSRIKKKYQFIDHRQMEYEIFSFYQKDEKQFIAMVLKGLPQIYRWSCWKIIMLANNSRINDMSFPRYIEGEGPCKEMIDKELHRTLVSNNFFKSNKEIGQVQLSRLLNAITTSIKGLSYSQGMNLLAGYLLVVSGGDEQLSFLCLSALMLDEKHLMYFVFSGNMWLLKFIQFFVYQKQSKHFPELSTKLPESTQIFWLQKWILTLFLDPLGILKSLRIWDYILIRGVILGVTEIAISILFQIKQKVIRSQNEMELYKSVNELEQLDIDKLINTSQNKFQISQQQLSSAWLEFASLNDVDYDLNKIMTTIRSSESMGSTWTTLVLNSCQNNSQR